MKTVTENAKVVGQVQTVQSADNDYLINFVIKTIREGQSASINVSTNPFRNWNLTNLKKGNQVQLTGKLTEEIWTDPFENSDWEILHLEATDVSILAA